MDVRGKFGEHEISLTEFFSLGFMAQAQKHAGAINRVEKTRLVL